MTAPGIGVARIMWTNEQICRWTGGSLAPSGRGGVVERVVIDSRKARSGDAFVALCGERSDGHEFVESALAAGAVVAIVSSQRGFGGRPDCLEVPDPLMALQEWAQGHLREIDPTVVAITGSNGKTTTKELVARVLGSLPGVARSTGNFNNQIGLPLSVLAMGRETRIAVLEMGMSSRGEIARLVEIAPPEIALITNVGPAHLAGLGGVEDVQRAKLEILGEGLSAPSLVVIPADDTSLVKAVESRVSGNTRLTRFGLGPGCDIRATEIEFLSNGGTRFQVEGMGRVTLSLPGVHNVMNALAAAAVGREMGVTPDEIREGLERADPVEMRSERVCCQGITIINDAYNANPASMAAAITAMSELPTDGRKVLVLGDMLELGPRSRDYHRGVGMAVDAGRFDLLVTVGELSRDTSSAAGRLAGSGRTQHFETAVEAGDYVSNWVCVGDVVLVKGSRGGALEEVVSRLIEALNRGDRD